MPTVKDVASKANVSPGTVSNVLTGKRPVAPATRERVLSVIDELGYQPNILARSLINRRSETIAVVASGLEYFGPSQAVTGIEREADRQRLLRHSRTDPLARPQPNEARARHARRPPSRRHHLGSSGDRQQPRLARGRRICTGCPPSSF